MLIIFILEILFKLIKALFTMYYNLHLHLILQFILNEKLFKNHKVTEQISPLLHG